MFKSPLDSFNALLSILNGIGSYICIVMHMKKAIIGLSSFKVLSAIVLWTFFGFNFASAQQTIQDRQLLENKKKQNAFNEAGFNFQGSYTYTRKVLERSEAENSDYSIFSYSLLYRGFKPWMVRAGLNFFNDKDIVSDENRQLYLSSGSIRFIRSPFKISDFTIQPGFGFRLPVGEYDRKSESLILGSNASATVFLPSSWMPKKTLGIVGASLNKNFHNYDTRLGSGPNTEWSADLFASLNYTLNHLVTLVLSGSYGTAFTYTPESFEYYSFSQSIFMAYQKFNLSIGHSIESSVYAVDGVNYDVRFFDENRSRFYVNLGLNL